VSAQVWAPARAQAQAQAWGTIRLPAMGPGVSLLRPGPTRYRPARRSRSTL